MAKTQRPRRVQRYSGQFKLTAVRLSETPGVQVKDVADALDVHPFMLSKWRREAREGTIQPDLPNKPKAVRQYPAKPKPAIKVVRVVRPPSAAIQGELRRYAELKREHALLKKEHELLKKAIRFCSSRNATSSRSSRRNGTGSRSPGYAISSASAVPAITRGPGAGPVATPGKTRR